MLQLDFIKIFCICTEAYETHYKDGSFPEKMEILEHMKL